MTFEELQERIYGLAGRTIERKDFHRHSNGGGWVENTAQVDETVFVGEYASAWDYAQARENARICDSTIIRNRATISGHACADGESELCDDSALIDYSRVSGCVRLSGRSRLSENSAAVGIVTIDDDVQLCGAAYANGEITICQSAKASENAEICGLGVMICGDTWIRASSKIRGPIYLEGGEWNKTPLCWRIGRTDNICVNHSKSGYTAISVLSDGMDYTSKPHQFWLSNEGEQILKTTGLTNLEVTECQKHVRTIMETERKNRIIVKANRSILNVTQKLSRKFGLKMS